MAAPLRRAAQLRAPAVPLVPIDPYFSIWSAADQLTDADAKGNPTILHWTNAPQPLTSMIRIDGKPFRIMGVSPKDVPALAQKKIDIQPTTVTYTFAGEGVQVELAFLTPLLPEDLLLFSRPVTYLTWSVQSTDGATHDVQVYYDHTADLVVNDPRNENVICSQETFGSIKATQSRHC